MIFAKTANRTHTHTHMGQAVRSHTRGDIYIKDTVFKCVPPEDGHSSNVEHELSYQQTLYTLQCSNSTITHQYV